MENPVLAFFTKHRLFPNVKSDDFTLSFFLSFFFFVIKSGRFWYVRVKFWGHFWCHRILNVIYFWHVFFFNLIIWLAHMEESFVETMCIDWIQGVYVVASGYRFQENIDLGHCNLYTTSRMNKCSIYWFEVDIKLQAKKSFYETFLRAKMCLPLLNLLFWLFARRVF